MLFLRSKRTNIDMKVIDTTVRAYFKCLKNNNLELNCSEISELLRYSICSILDLQSKGYSRKIEEYSKLIKNEISGVVLSNISITDSEDRKMGFLEACVHSMEMSRRKVD